MQRHLVISVDYEVFGNGTGDVRQHMTEPTERMARMCEAHKVPLTVFFEVEEFLAFEKHRSELKALLGYDPAAEIREQIKSFAARGHDIQLQLHPEWVGARFEAGQWVLRPERQTVDSLFESEAETVAYIAERKGAIDEILTEAGSSQRVHVYRAGAFSAQPGKKLLRALQANEIYIDSSVVQGLTRQNPHVTLDYRAQEATSVGATSSAISPNPLTFKFGSLLTSRRNSANGSSNKCSLECPIKTRTSGIPSFDRGAPLIYSINLPGVKL